WGGRGCPVGWSRPTGQVAGGRCGVPAVASVRPGGAVVLGGFLERSSHRRSATQLARIPAFWSGAGALSWAVGCRRGASWVPGGSRPVGSVGSVGSVGCPVCSIAVRRSRSGRGGSLSGSAVAAGDAGRGRPDPVAAGGAFGVDLALPVAEAPAVQPAQKLRDAVGGDTDQPGTEHGEEIRRFLRGPAGGGDRRLVGEHIG